MKWNLGWNHTRNFKIERARSARSIWNHKYDFRPKLLDTRFNYHFITSILKLPKYRTWSIQTFYWCSTEPVWNLIRPFIGGGGGGITVLETKVAKFATILFFFHFPAIWLFSLKSLEIWLVVLFLLWPSHWLGKRCDLKQKNGAIRESNASIRANQITGTTNDFKMGVINTI